MRQEEPKFLCEDDRDLQHPHKMEPYRYFDPVMKRTVIKVQPGTHYVTKAAEEVIATTLGSCVAVCIRDRDTLVGGMNHFMLPQGSGGEGAWGNASASLRYGDYAMEVLINSILKLGGAKNRLEIKVFGGANVLPGSSNDVGAKNVRFVQRFLRNEHMAPSAEHLGGRQGRQIRYYLESGKVKMKLLGEAEGKDVLKAEEELKRNQHYGASREYIAYAEGVRDNPDLWCKWSEKYINWRQLEILGLMSKGNWA